MKSRFYHQPSPWNPGYAIPDYVLAEPLERGTFTTQWLPRGTIPEMLPDYLARSVGARYKCSLAESSLSRNSLAGSSLGGDSLSGDSLGAQVYELEPLGADATTKYGKLAARAMISRIKTLPAKQRGPALKQALKQLDPTLPARCQKYAEDYQRLGVPAAAALEGGIARAMSEGVTAQLTRMGAGRARPQSRSLRGLGRTYTSLGADPQIAAFMQLPPTMTAAFFQPPMLPQEGDCDAKRTAIFRSGHWQRKRADETCVRVLPGTTGETRDHRGADGAPQGGVTVSGPAVIIGLFAFPVAANGEAVDGQRISWNSTNKLSQGRQKYFAGRFEALKKSAVYRTPGFVSIDGALIGQPGVKVPALKTLISGSLPIDGGVNRATGQHWAMRLVDIDKNGPGSGAVVIKKYTPDKGVVDTVVGTAGGVLGGAAGVVKGALDAAKDIACSVLGQPEATQAAMAAGQPHLAAGTMVASSVCSSPTPGASTGPAMEEQPATGTGWILPVAIGAGGLVLLAVLARR